MTITNAAQKRQYKVDFKNPNNFQLTGEDVSKLRELGYAVEKRYNNETSFIVSWNKK